MLRDPTLRLLDFSYVGGPVTAQQQPSQAVSWTDEKASNRHLGKGQLPSNDAIFDWSFLKVCWPAATFLNQIITRRYDTRLAGSVQRGILGYPPVAVEPRNALSLNQPKRNSL